jgi:hypothetical protein
MRKRAAVPARRKKLPRPEWCKTAQLDAVPRCTAVSRSTGCSCQAPALNGDKRDVILSNSALRCRQAFACITSKSMHASFTALRRLGISPPLDSAASPPINRVGHFRAEILACAVARAATFTAPKVRNTVTKVPLTDTSHGRSGDVDRTVLIGINQNSRTSASREKIERRSVTSCSSATGRNVCSAANRSRRHEL